MNMEKKWIWLVMVAAVIGILSIKGIQLGWFTTGQPVNLKGKPALLLFNKDQGCPCVQVVYQNADIQISGWSSTSMQNIPIHRINLEERPDLGKHYAVNRAPALLLLDRHGNEVWRQYATITSEQVFDLKLFEDKITTLTETH